MKSRRLVSLLLITAIVSSPLARAAEVDSYTRNQSPGENGRYAVLKVSADSSGEHQLDPMFRFELCEMETPILNDADSAPALLNCTIIGKAAGYSELQLQQHENELRAKFNERNNWVAAGSLIGIVIANTYMFASLSQYAAREGYLLSTVLLSDPLTLAAASGAMTVIGGLIGAGAGWAGSWVVNGNAWIQENAVAASANTAINTSKFDRYHLLQIAGFDVVTVKSQLTQFLIGVKP